VREALAFAVVLGLLSVMAQPSSAVTTRSFLLDEHQTFSDAEMKGIALWDDGVIQPGPDAVALSDAAGSQVWCLLRASDGSIYAGTGSDGAIYRLDGGGASSVKETFEYEVFAIAEGANGEIYASGAPNGTIVEIAKSATPRTLFDTPERVVWALLTDRRGNLYAGTGDRGHLYKITPGGEAEVLYRAGDSHLISLAWSAEGKILAGTEGRGLLLEIDPDNGGAKVLYDAPFKTVSKVVASPDGKIYFATSTAAEDSEDNLNSSDAEGEGSETPIGPSSSVFVREPDGTVRTVWRSAEETAHGLALDQAGRVLVGTGERATVYRVSPNGETTMIWKPEEGQVLALLVAGSEILAGTGNPGRIYRLGPGQDDSAWIRPKPLDTTTSATWGRAIWEVLPGAGRWVLRTRSGHTDHPDSSWSDWSAELAEPDGSQVLSPAGRFLQCEARYHGEGGGRSARLRQIWIPYSEPNLAPRVRSISFSPDGFSSGGGVQESSSYSENLGAGLQIQIQQSTPQNGESGSDGAPPWVRGVRTVVWTAEDPNRDALSFEVALRQVGEERFRVVVRDHTISAYAIDTRTLPEGEYEVRVLASDAPSNPPGAALESAKIGGPFRVDHRPPEILDLNVRRVGELRLLVGGKAIDASSPILHLEVSWDGGAWIPVAPLDGFLDSTEEEFQSEIELEREEDGSWAAIRAVDTSGNEAIGRVWMDD